MMFDIQRFSISLNRFKIDLNDIPNNILINNDKIVIEYTQNEENYANNICQAAEY